MKHFGKFTHDGRALTLTSEPTPHKGRFIMAPWATFSGSWREATAVDAGGSVFRAIWIKPGSPVYSPDYVISGNGLQKAGKGSK